MTRVDSSVRRDENKAMPKLRDVLKQLGDEKVFIGFLSSYVYIGKASEAAHYLRWMGKKWEGFHKGEVERLQKRLNMLKSLEQTKEVKKAVRRCEKNLSIRREYLRNFKQPLNRHLQMEPYESITPIPHLQGTRLIINGLENGDFWTEEEFQRHLEHIKKKEGYR